MNDSTSYSFSFSYDLSPKRAGGTPPADLMAFDICREYPLPENQVLLRSSHSHRQTIVTSDVLYSLRQCLEFKTLEEHSRHLQNVIPELAGQDQDIGNVLNSVSQAGLMLSAAAKARELRPVVRDDAAEASGACYCILSCDRPEAVKRLLASMQQSHDFNGRNRYWLVDDSRDADKQQANRQLCDIFQNEYDLPLEYFGMHEQREALEQMKQDLPEHRQGLDFLLGRQPDESIPSYGRSRNWSLLLGAGGRLVLLDDDILYQRARPPQALADVMLTSAVRSADFFSSDDAWRSLLDADRPDPCSGAFTQALGRRLPEALALFTREVLPTEALRHLSPRDYHHFNNDSRVKITACGSLGDPGTSGNQWLLQLDAESRKRLFVSESHYRQHLQHPNLWSGRKGAAFLNTFTLISQATGLDASELLPPYFPIQRNEDLLFGEMLRYLYPHALQLDLPWALPHLPLERRDWTHEQLTRPSPIGMLSFAARMLTQHQEQDLAKQAGVRMRSLASLFHGLADASDKDLVEAIAQASLQRYSLQIGHLNDILAESPDAPDYWRQDIQTYLVNLQQALFGLLPEGFALMAGAPQAQRDTARRLWEDFARGLDAWSSAMEWAENRL